SVRATGLPGDRKVIALASRVAGLARCTVIAKLVGEHAIAPTVAVGERETVPGSVPDGHRTLGSVVLDVMLDQPEILGFECPLTVGTFMVLQAHVVVLDVAPRGAAVIEPARLGGTHPRDCLGRSVTPGREFGVDRPREGFEVDVVADHGLLLTSLLGDLFL